MKKIIYCLLTLLSLSFFSTAQEASPVATMPAHANGYLLLNKGFYNTVSSWHVIVKAKTWNAATSTYTYTTRLDQTLTGKNYLKIPAAYRNVNHVMEITGYAGTTTVVHVSEMPIGDPTELLCSWVCNGSNYAYALELNLVPSQGAKIRMAPALPPSDAPYYYQWIPESNWNNFRSLNASSAYGYSSWAWADQYAGNGIIHITLPAGEYKYDQFGSPMAGNVVGLSKYFGPYVQSWGSIYSNSLYLTGSECANPISWALDQVNNGPNPVPDAVCVGTSYNTNVVEMPFAEVPDPEAGESEPCFEYFYDEIGWNGTSGSGVYQFIKIPCDWLSAVNSGTGTGTGIHWPEHVSRITMKSLFGSVSGDPVTIVLENASLFNEQGNFVGPNYTIPAGFYSIMYQYEDLSLAAYYVEVPTTTGSVLTEKEFLTYTAYPVPVVDNTFRIDFAASKKVEFTYELRDAHNHLLFTDHYTVLKDEQVTKEIAPASGIPDGMLYCRLIFSDNSVTNFTIVK
jgi:hypothetical protein